MKIESLGKDARCYKHPNRVDMQEVSKHAFFISRNGKELLRNKFCRQNSIRDTGLLEVAYTTCRIPYMIESVTAMPHTAADRALKIITNRTHLEP